MIAASLLSADLARLADAIAMLEGVVDYVHCDVMDGHFVPNLTFGHPVVRAVKRASRLPLDIHLMIENPDRWVPEYLAAGLDERDYLTFHVEATDDPGAIIERIRSSGVRAGVSLKPGTAPQVLDDIVAVVDQVLVMTVEPGFGGQQFMQDMLPKVGYFAARMPEEGVVAVDGGIDASTAPLAAAAGAGLFIAGNAIYGRDDPVAAARELRRALDAA